MGGDDDAATEIGTMIIDDDYVRFVVFVCVGRETALVCMCVFVYSMMREH